MKSVPPYVPFGTFKNLLLKLRTSMPEHIDNSLMAGKSDSIKSQLYNCLRHFGLVNGDGQAMPDLHELVRLIEANNEKRREVWKRVLRKGYAELIERDPRMLTTEIIRDSLRRGGLISPHTLNKGVNFFCRAVKQAGINLPTHVKPYAGVQRSRKKNQRALFTLSKQALDPSTDGLRAWQRFAEKFPDLNEDWPIEVQIQWLQSYDKLLDMRRELSRQARGPKKKKK
jgi:hypothetical protein